MSQPNVLREAISDDRAWTADTIDAPASWHCPLSDEGVAELDRVVRSVENGHRPLTEMQIDRSHFEACAGAFLPAIDALSTGRGFVVVDPPGTLTANSDRARAAYWLLGQLIGAPFEQDMGGSLLYDVRDTGQNRSPTPSDPAVAESHRLSGRPEISSPSGASPRRIAQPSA